VSNCSFAGNIDEYEQLVAKFDAQLSAQPVLVQNRDLLKRKIAIMALMELVFTQSSVNRAISFELIAKTTKLPVEEVELLVMKALCLKVVKGVIDQVSGIVYFTWVQPRVLDIPQVASMQSNLANWSKTVQQMRNTMEDNTTELFS